MRRCDEAHADAQIDGAFYRLDTLAEFKVIKKRARMLGVVLRRPRETESRLVEKRRLKLLAEEKVVGVNS